MLQPRLWASSSTQRILTSSGISNNGAPLLAALSRLSITPSQIQTRAASHASQGRANKAAPGPGKRLGAKKSDSEPVVPGNIIFRQRGTLWFPGENVTMGRDHTISATAKGFVRYYRDPEKNPDKKYIGVVFEQNEQLPRGRNASRKRRLGMEAVIIEEVPTTEGEQLVDDVVRTETPSDVVSEIENLAPGARPANSLRAGFQYRESNWSIGRTAERKGIQVVPFDKTNRWSRWRINQKNKKKALEMQKIRRNTKNAKKGNKKKQKGN